MDDQTKRGYARLIFDLAKSDRNDSFQRELASTKGATEGLSRLLQLAKQLGTRITGEGVTQPDQLHSRDSR